MNSLLEAINASIFEDLTKSELLLIAPGLTTIEQFRVKKALDMGSLSLIKLLLFKKKHLITELKKLQDPIPVDPKHQPFSFTEFSWGKLVEQIEQVQPNTVAVGSFLTRGDFLGEAVAKLDEHQGAVPYLDSIENITDYKQLAQLDTLHVSFMIDDNPDQKLLLFQEALDMLTLKMLVSAKRAVFLYYLRSPLFYKYTFTGLTALNLKTDLPRKTLLNVLHQNEDKFLTASQFEWTAKLTKILRGFAAI